MKCRALHQGPLPHHPAVRGEHKATELLGRTRACPQGMQLALGSVLLSPVGHQGQQVPPLALGEQRRRWLCTRNASPLPPGPSAAGSPQPASARRVHWAPLLRAASRALRKAWSPGVFAQLSDGGSGGEEGSAGVQGQVLARGTKTTSSEQRRDLGKSRRPGMCLDPEGKTWSWPRGAEGRDAVGALSAQAGHVTLDPSTPPARAPESRPRSCVRARSQMQLQEQRSEVWGWDQGLYQDPGAGPASAVSSGQGGTPAGKEEPCPGGGGLASPCCTGIAELRTCQASGAAERCPADAPNLPLSRQPGTGTGTGSDRPLLCACSCRVWRCCEEVCWLWTRGHEQSPGQAARLQLTPPRLPLRHDCCIPAGEGGRPGGLRISPQVRGAQKC